jgi:23S rRNA (guanosine2251-2'-O)-methyltransferase
LARASSALGGEQVEGRHAVRELLRARTRRVKAVYVSNTAEGVADIVELAGGLVRLVPAERVAALARSDAHQGVVAVAAPLEPADLVTLLRAPDALLVALEGVTDPHNLGAVLRTADTAGATGVIVPRRRAAHVTPTVTKAAAGAIEHMPIALVGGIPNALERAQREKVWTVGLDGRADQTVDALAVATEPLVLVLGAEGRGLSRLTRERCDVTVRIPMYGHVESLNVAAAAAIALHAVAARRHTST